MQLSTRTIDILRNFSSINANLVVDSGNVIKTMSAARNLVSCAEIDETFPQSFGIYDLAEFLSVISLVNNPQITFSDSYCTVSDASGLSSIKYFYSDREMLSYPKKDIVMPDCEVKFLLNVGVLQQIKRAAAALGHKELSVTPSGGSVQISVIDPKDSTSNSFSVVVDGQYPQDLDFNLIFSVDNFKLLAEDYEVKVSSKMISNFKSLDSNIEYFIALEKASTYGA